MDILQQARILRRNIVKGSISLEDKDASLTPELFDGLKEDGSLISVGTRINWNNTIKRAAVDIWDTKENNPDNAPQLWEDLPYKNGIRIIPETITTGTLFMKDELGYWGDDLYKSLIDNNVWTPVAYPAGWELVEIAK
jgi:hypothetical protein